MGEDGSPAFGASERDALAFEAWTLATFDVVAFTLIFVLAGHASGGLAGSLSRFGTLPGVAVFGYLWGLVFLATRWVLADGGLDRLDAGETSALVIRGTLGGALVGTSFVGGLGLILGLATLGGPGELSSVALFTAFGAVGGAVGGLVVGLVFALVNVGLYRLAATVVSDAPRDPA